MRSAAWIVTGLAIAAPTPGSAQTPPPAPKSVELETADGVTLRAAYYAPDRTPRAPIAVLIGDEGESRSMLASLADRLQRPGAGNAGGKPRSWAVLAVDLRGQGDSVRGQTATGQRVDLRDMKLTKQAITAMVQQDMEAARRFLVAKNDAGEVNINRMAYVGVGLGALVATNSAAIDWSVGRLNTAKQGQDVKALALISPPWNQKGVGVLNALRQPGVQREVAVMLMYGREHRKSTGDAKRIYRELAKARPEMPEPTNDSLPKLLEIGGPSKLRGSAWLKEAGAEGESLIKRFLDEHVAEPDYAWTKRRLD